MNNIFLQIIAELFSISVGFIFFKKKSISLSGFIALIVITSTLISLMQFEALILMFTMFASSSLLTKYKKHAKSEFDKIITKTGPRDAVQAFANLGAGFIFSIAYSLTENSIFIAGFIGSIAAANADSWASEIGGLSSKAPVSILTFKTVKKGISGGVTSLGFIGGIAGALFIIIIAMTLFYTTDNLSKILLSSFISAIVGFVGDSYIGAVFQALYIDQNNNLTESKKDNVTLIKGYNWINNDGVNLITTMVAGVFGILFYFLFM